MAKQAFFVETMVSLADTLVDDFDVVEVLTMLSGRCAELLGVSAAAVLLASPEGKLTYLASSRHSTQEWDLSKARLTKDRRASASKRNVLFLGRLARRRPSGPPLLNTPSWQGFAQVTLCRCDFVVAQSAC